MHRAYWINSADLIDALQQGKRDAFINVSRYQSFLPPYAAQPVEWSQSDFLYVTQSLHRSIWQESLDNYSLKDMQFSLKCTETAAGPQSAQLRFFKTEDTDQYPSQLIHDFVVLPDENKIAVNASRYSLYDNRWQAIDWAVIKIPVEDALQIAEHNGGALFRKETDNRCAISAEITSDNNGKWVIIYSSGSGDQEKSFKLEIDTQTGDVKKIH